MVNFNPVERALLLPSENHDVLHRRMLRRLSSFGVGSGKHQQIIALADKFPRPIKFPAASQSSYYCTVSRVTVRHIW